MTWSLRLERRILPFAWLFLAGCAWSRSHSGALPRFEDYPVTEFFTREPVAPKLVTPQDQSYADQFVMVLRMDSEFSVTTRNKREQTSRGI